MCLIFYIMQTNKNYEFYFFSLYWFLFFKKVVVFLVTKEGMFVQINIPNNTSESQSYS